MRMRVLLALLLACCAPHLPTLAATAVGGVVLTVSPPATCPLGGSLGDGCPGAPSGTIQRPTLLNYTAQIGCSITVPGSGGDAGTWCRPPWNMPGVDYYVGLPTGTVLQDPATSGPAGTSYNSSTHTLSVNVGGVTLNGFDFSLHGGIQLLSGGTGGTVVENCYFADTGNHNIPIYLAAGTITIINSTIDLGGAGNTGFVGFGDMPNGGGDLTVEYSYLLNSGARYFSMENNGKLTYKYDLFVDIALAPGGVHGNIVQWSSANAFSSPDIEYDVFIAPDAPGASSGGEGIQVYNNTNGSGTILNAVVSNNFASGNFSNEFHLGSNAQFPTTATGVANNNYVDNSLGGAFYGGLSGFTYSGNINVLTGASCNGNC